jgi:hypothetical protein
MTDLQKDQAIYQAMCEIASNVFDNAIANNAELRKYMSENGGVVTINDITKARSDVYTMIDSVTKFNDCTNEGLQTVTVDTFTCSFPPMRVFELVKYWKSLAKARGDMFFTYEEEIERDFVGSVDITIDNPANARLLANSVADNELQPVMNNILLEINATSGDINFVASDGRELGVISNNPAAVCTPYEAEDRVFQALFGKNDWKLICDYARKAKSAVRFEIYERGTDEQGHMECADTMIAVLGDTKVKSQQRGRYPNWKSVLQDFAKMKHFTLCANEAKDAQKWLSKVKTYSVYDAVDITAYKGSDIIYFDFEGRTQTYRLSAPSDITIGTRVSIKRLQQKKFCGFHLPKCGGGIIVDDENTDLMLLMPFEASCIHDKHEREVIYEENLVGELIVA